ncbi:MAG: glutaminase A [Lachnospiraceae bacterium]|nr:glutaminase A [Lachnospiraceae bacterium]
METQLDLLTKECVSYTKNGNVADYIPELSKADPGMLGAYMIAEDGSEFFSGDYMQPFTIQSIVKTILLLQALIDNGVEAVSEKVGMEATGKPFDAINVTEQKLDSRHLNPMVNMGAILMCTLIAGNTYEERFSRVLELTRILSGNPTIDIERKVYLSEKTYGSKNRALAYLLKANGMLADDVEEVLDCYFQACSISVTCKDLANIGVVLANRGRRPGGDEFIVPEEYARYVNATLITCGMYDGSGEFALRVGVPAKSGVGGGIMAIAPARMGIGIFSPALDEKGNSVAGIQLLEKISRQFKLSIF